MKTGTYTLLELLNKVNLLCSTSFADEYLGNSELINELSTFEFRNFGTIALKEENDSFIIVDGLQRLVTFSLLLYALCECYKKTSSKNDNARNKIFTRYLTTKEKNASKINLLFDKEKIYEKIILSNKLTDDEKKSQIFEVLHEFWQKIKEDNISATKLFKKICKMKAFVIVIKEETVDLRDLYITFNPQKVNPLYMVSDFIKQNCEEDFVFWNNVVKKYSQYSLEDCLNNFLRDYLSSRLDGIEITDSEIYSCFKEYFYTMKKYRKDSEIIRDLNIYAGYYLKILHADFEDLNVQKMFTEIKENSGYDTYPYLMEVLDDLNKSNISDEMFVEIIGMIAKFVRERDEDTKINFATFGNNIKKMLLTN